MNHVREFIVWLFWIAVYAFRNRWKQERFGNFLIRVMRCRKPWAQFQPHVSRNDAMQEWAVWLEDKPACTERRTIEVDVHVCDETGNVIGFDIPDHVLSVKQPDRETGRL